MSSPELFEKIKKGCYETLKELMKINNDIAMDSKPQFDKSSKYDWKRFVPEDVRHLWPTMSYESRVVAKYLQNKLLIKHLLQTLMIEV